MPASDPTTSTPSPSALRRTMVDCQLRTVDVTDHAVLARFLEVPREAFLPADLAALAYSDMDLKLAGEVAGASPRVLLAPAVLGRLIQAGAVKPGDKVLDVASATGYSSAILAGLAQEVVALESDPARAATMEANLAANGLSTIRVLVGALSNGAPAEAPFDVIFVHGAVECHLEALLQQLRPGGRLVTIRHVAEGPDKGASFAVRFEERAGQLGSSILFDAAAPVLPEFRKEPEFVF